MYVEIDGYFSVNWFKYWLWKINNVCFSFWNVIYIWSLWIIFLLKKLLKLNFLINKYEFGKCYVKLCVYKL